jgi:hypothetical protein
MTSRLWTLAVSAMEREGSTRAVALVRIGLVLLVWARWAKEILPFRDLDLDRVVLSLAFFATTTWMLLGYHGRAATAAAAGVIGAMVFWFGRVQGIEDWTHHHTTLFAYLFAFLALTPNSTSLSVDRWLAVRRAQRLGLPPPPEQGPLWATPLLGLQLSTLYFWSAWDKSSVGFLSGFRLEQIFVEVWWVSDWWPPAAVRGVFAVMAVSVVLTEYFLAFALWVRRWHWLVIPLGMTLHALFYLLIPVNTFSLTMCLLYLAFLDPGTVHRIIDELLGVPPAPAS